MRAGETRRGELCQHSEKIIGATAEAMRCALAALPEQGVQERSLNDASLKDAQEQVSGCSALGVNNSNDIEIKESADLEESTPSTALNEENVEVKDGRISNHSLSNNPFGQPAPSALETLNTAEVEIQNVGDSDSLPTASLDADKIGEKDVHITDGSPINNPFEGQGAPESDDALMARIPLVLAALPEQCMVDDSTNILKSFVAC